MSKSIKRQRHNLLEDQFPGYLRNVETTRAVIQGVGSRKGLYTLDALTIENWPRRFLVIGISEEDRGQRLTRLKQRQCAPWWTKPRATKVLSYKPSTTNLQSCVSPVSSAGVAHEDEHSEFQWTSSPHELLSRLEDESTTEAERRIAIMVAEATAFDESTRGRLLPVLSSFISMNRFATDEETIIVLGSAIRKYAMNMGETDFGTYACWLWPTMTETLHHEVELELAKGANWRVAYERTSNDGGLADLKVALAGLAREYMSPRLILQKNYASIVIQAVVGVAILEALTGQHRETEELLKQTSQLRMDWFAELLRRRLDDACKAIEEHDPQLADAVRKLAVVGIDA